MAGHRKARGRPKRAASRAQAARERLAAAPTEQARLVAAFDWFRSAVARDGKRREPDGRGPALAREAAGFLTRAAAQLEGKQP